MTKRDKQWLAVSMLDCIFRERGGCRIEGGLILRGVQLPTTFEEYRVKGLLDFRCTTSRVDNLLTPIIVLCRAAVGEGAEGEEASYGRACLIMSKQAISSTHPLISVPLPGAPSLSYPSTSFDQPYTALHRAARSGKKKAPLYRRSTAHRTKDNEATPYSTFALKGTKGGGICE